MRFLVLSVLLLICGAAQADALGPAKTGASSSIEVGQTFDRLLDTTPFSAGADTFATTRILPVVRHIDQIGSVDAGSTPISVPLAGDLRITYVIDYPSHRAAMTAETVTKAGLATPDLHALALSNLLAKSQSAVITGSEEGLYFLALDGANENALLLDAGLWDDVTDQLGPIVMSIPASDRVLFVPAENEPALQIMQDIRDDILSNRPYGLSEQLFTWTGESWRVLPD